MVNFTSKFACSLFASLIVTNTLFNTAESAPIQWTVGSGGNGHWYEYVEGSINWTDAKAAAESSFFAGYWGHLATLTSSEETDFVFSSFGTPYNVLLGGFQLPESDEPDQGWQWVTGEPWSYTSWGPGEPNNQYAGGFGGDVPNGSSEEVLGFWIQPSTWNDIPINALAPGYIVEYDEYGIPEPSTVMLLAIGASGLYVFRKRRRC